MAELLRRGFIAALAPQGSPKIDILVTDTDGAKQLAIQVKTRKGNGSGWHMHKKHEDINDPNLFYVFVDLGKSHEDTPEYYVMPSKRVAEVVYETHKAWERNPGRGGRQRSQTNDMRRINPDYTSNYTNEPPQFTLGWLDEYKEAWRLFETS